MQSIDYTPWPVYCRLRADLICKLHGLFKALLLPCFMSAQQQAPFRQILRLLKVCPLRFFCAQHLYSENNVM